MTIRLSVARLRCRNQGCSRRIFAERLPAIVAPLARRTDRQADVVHLLAHGMGGRLAERVMVRLGMPASPALVDAAAPTMIHLGAAWRNGSGNSHAETRWSARE